MNYYGKPDPEDFKPRPSNPRPSKPKTKLMKLTEREIREFSGADEFEKFSNMSPITQKEIDRAFGSPLGFNEFNLLIHRLQL